MKLIPVDLPGFTCEEGCGSKAVWMAEAIDYSSHEPQCFCDECATENGHEKVKVQDDD